MVLSEAAGVDVRIRPDWQQQLASAISDPAELARLLQLDLSEVSHHFGARSLFPMRVPKHFVNLMEQGNPNDPLLLQVLPHAEEFHKAPGYSKDPLVEHDGAQPSLLHKYKSRVLVIFRGGCAINCRYCFRRHFPYQEHHFGAAERAQLIQYLEQHPEINEVILSGGDPLLATDAQLARLLEALEKLPQLTRIRIHSRLPVVIPARLTTELAQRLEQSRLQAILVLHTNHPNEIAPQLVKRLNVWREHHITLLNQSVLLKGINDQASILIELSEKLFEAGVLPYYLHQLDKVEGAHHFAVSDAEALALENALRSELPGFLVPKLVREIAGEASKTPLQLI